MGTAITLTTNIIGKFFGLDSVSIDDQHFQAFHRGSLASSIALTNFTQFAACKNGMFGATLLLEVEGKQRSIKFLRKLGVTDFLSALNQAIASNISKNIDSLSDFFTANVFIAYPRDSRIGVLYDLCQALSINYNAKKDIWNSYLPEETLAKIHELITHLPIDASSLRYKHETYFLEKRKQFFDHVESNPLTHEQRLGVLRSNDKNMVLAAAGTGKTSVIVAKTLDLIDRKLATPDEVLVLAYNRDAAEELQERLTSKAEKSHITLTTPPHISTFHALGRKLLKEANISTHISTFAEDELKLKQWVTQWIESYLRADTTRVYDLIELSTQPVNPFDFKSTAEYENYIRDNEFRTLNSDLVKGYQELQIANFLFINQVPYRYEAPYISKRRIEIGFDYRPDFHLVGTNIYIEHFGVDRHGNTRLDIDAIKYVESMQSKRALHKECETRLIETFHYEWCENTLLSGLKAKLQALGIPLNPMDPNEIFEKLNHEGHIANWSVLMKKALQAIRVERLTKETMLSRFLKAKVHHPEKHAVLFQALHDGYVDELHHQNAIDFDDMIIRAIQVVMSGRYIPKWKYILVDEFQDISSARMEFILALIEKGPEPSLTVVGDDWQSIYRFSGGKLELTTRFGEMVGRTRKQNCKKRFGTTTVLPTRQDNSSWKTLSNLKSR